MVFYLTYNRNGCAVHMNTSIDHILICPFNHITETNNTTIISSLCGPLDRHTQYHPACGSSGMSNILGYCNQRLWEYYRLIMLNYSTIAISKNLLEFIIQGIFLVWSIILNFRIYHTFFYFFFKHFNFKVKHIFQTSEVSYI